jgi:hypothetical protein
MKPRPLLLGILTAALTGLFALAGSAQFDTPNRAFHEAFAFRLEGRHQAVPCASCHVNGQYQGTPTTCYDCHWVRRQDDRFQTRLGTRCEQCHRPTSWIDTRWDHAGQTGIPLNASHRGIACESCHRNAEFRTVSVDCVSCHGRDFDQTTAPSHLAAGFPRTCDSCHLPGDSTWQRSGGAGFSHAAIFPLVGVHATVECQTCHRQNVYRGTPRDCVGCHEADYQATADPNHAAAGFPMTCEACHRPSDSVWSGGRGFDHAAVFALVGAHTSQTCGACHQNNVYQGTPRDCVGCHRDEYVATRNPNHVVANFPMTCENCHRATAAQWTGGAFNHNSVFTLVGVHALQDCAACHRDNVFQGTPRSCVGCHRDEYNSARNPNHVAANFPTSCESCHRPTDTRWGGGSFNHNTVFALVGVHATQACTSCHSNNVFDGTPRTCVGCHRGEYTATRDPNHATSGFPTTCESCHRAGDSSWGQGRFSHTWFPLSGPHNRACADCHTSPSNYNVFSCTVCHSRGETDDEHEGEVSGYRYDSAACYSCHPDGREH